MNVPAPRALDPQGDLAALGVDLRLWLADLDAAEAQVATLRDQLKAILTEALAR